MAALTALGAGANPIDLGVELPVEDLLDAVRCANATALALSIPAMNSARAANEIRALRDGLPEDVLLWIGGASASQLALPPRVEVVESLDKLEQRVMLLAP